MDLRIGCVQGTGQGWEMLCPRENQSWKLKVGIWIDSKGGADRAALDWALSHHLTCDGWCPKGRKAEDGAIDPKYPLQKTPSASYLQRTEWNVRDSDSTVLFSLASALTGGSRKTVEFAKKHRKPWIHFSAGDQEIDQRLKDWLTQNSVYVLNVAGPRASKEPGIASFVIRTLDAVFGF